MPEEFDCKNKHCYAVITIEDMWGALGEEVVCPSCGMVHELNYDESWDEEGGEHGWFWLEAK